MYVITEERFWRPGAEMTKSEFACKGDSGSGIISNDGKAVALLRARYVAEKTCVIDMFETADGKPDLQEFLKRRTANGDLEGATKTIPVAHLVLITPLEAVLQRISAVTAIKDLRVYGI
jgi:hypothetical protein